MSARTDAAKDRRERRLHPERFSSAPPRYEATIWTPGALTDGDGWVCEVDCPDWNTDDYEVEFESLEEAYLFLDEWGRQRGVRLATRFGMLLGHTNA